MQGLPDNHGRMSFHRFFTGRAAAFAALLYLAPTTMPEASPRLLVDMQSGEVLFSDDAAVSWHPASLTKLMTAYLAFKAVREGRATGLTPIVMTEHAASVPPSKLGIATGSGLRLDDALSIMLTRSMNDVATAIAENLSTSESAFVEDMNLEAARLGMKGTRFTNASGLPDVRQVSTAEDLAILSIRILSDYPERRWMFGVPELSVAGRTLRNTNGLIGRFAGSDGMKTGYVCGSGFNVVSTATRNGRQLLAVVLGAPNAKAREKAASAMLEYGFGRTEGSGSLSSKADEPREAVDLSRFACGRSYPDFSASLPTTKRAAAQPTAAPSEAGAPHKPAIRRF